MHRMIQVIGRLVQLPAQDKSVDCQPQSPATLVAIPRYVLKH